MIEENVLREYLFQLRRIIKEPHDHDCFNPYFYMDEIFDQLSLIQEIINNTDSSEMIRNRTKELINKYGWLT